MRRTLLSFFFSFLFGLLVCCTGSAQVIYVSSSIGSDANDGYSPNVPMKTINAALKKGDTIYLKAGDVFYEEVQLKNQTLTRYGKGGNPLICGLRRIEQPRWKKVEGNIWRLSLLEDIFSGFTCTGVSLQNNIGCIYDYEHDKILSRKVPTYDKLVRNWDIWQTSTFDFEKVPERYNDLYLYCEEDPNERKLELTVGGYYGITLNDANVYNVNVKGFGIGGINLFGKCQVKQCRIDVIGGSTMTAAGHFSPLGNGIDFWVSRDAYDCVIEDCYITRCYDCGCSIQASRQGKATPRNIVFQNNLIANCCQGWEDFLNNDEDVNFEDCYFRNNLVVNCGISEFGYSDTRFIYCNVLGYNQTGNRGMHITNNLFINGNYHCGTPYQNKYKSNKWENNTLFTSRGHFLLGYVKGTQDVIYIPKEKGLFATLDDATNDAIKRYRDMTGDATTRFIIKSDKKVLKKGRKEVKKYLKTHKY